MELEDRLDQVQRPAPPPLLAVPRQPASWLLKVLRLDSKGERCRPGAGPQFGPLALSTSFQDVLERVASGLDLAGGVRVGWSGSFADAELKC